LENGDSKIAEFSAEWMVNKAEQPVHILSGAQHSLPKATQSPTAPESQDLVTRSVVGNKCSGKYHLPYCSGYSQINLENLVEFASTAEAEAAGYRRAGNRP